MTSSFAVAGSLTDIDARLAASESALPDIRPGLGKDIPWAAPETKNRTALAIVYIHGLSASKGEVRPLPDLVSKALGANLLQDADHCNLDRRCARQLGFCTACIGSTRRGRLPA